MKKILNVLLCMFIVSLCLTAQDKTIDASADTVATTDEIVVSDVIPNQTRSEIDRLIKITKDTNFYDNLHFYIDKQVTAYIANGDTVVKGRLIGIFADGFIIRNMFGQTIFVSKTLLTHIDVKGINIISYDNSLYLKP